MQHLISSYREEDVENENATEDLLHRRTKGDDVGCLTDTIHRLNVSLENMVGYARLSVDDRHAHSHCRKGKRYRAASLPVAQFVQSQLP
jgi:hypothetical protein